MVPGMNEVFVDTVYWIALVSPNDTWHRAAMRAKERLGDERLVTTDGVLSEFLAGTAKAGKEGRREASAMVRDLMDDPDIEVIRQTRELYFRGLDVYQQYESSKLSLQDCISIVVMRERQIMSILTGDAEFRGFNFRQLMHEDDR